MASAAFSSSPRSVQWRFKGSSTPYSPVSLPLPVFCGEIRAYLKAQTGLEATPQLDALLFLESDPSTPLSDLLPLRQPCSLLLQRTSAAEAKAALEVADRAFHQQKRADPGARESAASAGASRNDVSAERGSRQTPPLAERSAAGAGRSERVPAAYDLGGDPLSTSGELSAPTGRLPSSAADPSVERRNADSANNDEEDEAALLHAVIEQHAEHRGPQASSSQATSSAFGSSDGSRFSAGFYSGAAGLGRGRGWGFGAGRGFQAPSLGHGSAAGPGAPAPGYAVGRGSVGAGLPGGGGYVPVGEDYICHMCGERGHHIRNCTRSNDPRHQKKIRPATGIPSSFLRDISVEEIPRYAEVYIRKASPAHGGQRGGSRTLPDANRSSAVDGDGSFAVMKNAKQLSSLSYFSSDLDTKIERHVGSSDVAAHLKCPLCGLLFSQPVATPCCGETFCRGCLLRALHPSRGTAGLFAGSSGLPGDSGLPKKLGGGCPSCGQAIDLRDVLCNTALQKSVDAIVRSTSSFKEPGDTESTRPAFPAAVSTVPGVSGRGVAASSGGSVQRTAGVSTGDVSSGVRSGDVAEKGEKKDPATCEFLTDRGDGQRLTPSALTKTGASVETKEENKENGSSDVKGDGSGGACCPSGEACSVKTELVEREVCPRDGVALKDTVGTQAASGEPDPLKNTALGATLLQIAAASTTPADDSMNRENVPGDHGNGTQGQGSVGCSEVTTGGPATEALTGLPPGVDLQELEE
ncbi:hypothetical protein NCLIV_062930 [Neospora caninum Liverpool]|uniref:CCHC-type domain-containing protein n=1 Tax=Neospora caninum (strain Liverpool) TaxID=572307 RepID=F0VQ70_NEOCL|nr:hypothetical protein NCLIV_062930 [Neospora caninum Liverpool]CBZ55867.1 hypothetical protein NCLIV_062930 [Neospora caninum Liverpool]|eukprot:XP_003885893.1 hypothetical protein NCLIV_062930 [Neospora caninum Liverpool]